MGSPLTPVPGSPIHTNSSRSRRSASDPGDLGRALPEVCRTHWLRRGDEPIGPPLARASSAGASPGSARSTARWRWRARSSANTRTSDWSRVVLEGELDLATAPTLALELERLECGRPARVLVDLRGLTFMDLAGMRVLLAAHERARRCGGGFTVVRGPPIVERLMQLLEPTPCWS